MRSGGASRASRPSPCLLLLAAGLGLALVARGEDEASWPRWRSPDDNGGSPQGSYPMARDGTKVLWKVPLPGKGCSTRAVWNRRVSLTAPANGEDVALAP